MHTTDFLDVFFDIPFIQSDGVSMHLPSLFLRTFTASLFLSLAACTSSTGTQQSSESASSSAMSESSAQSSVTSDMIHVTSPLANATLVSPFTVTGEAVGPWYFEASFPIVLLDGNGQQILATHANALSDWMTNDMVPFSSLLTFSKPSTTTGTLILKRDNPSDLTQNSQQIDIPIRF